MARARSPRNGSQRNGRLEEALVNLVQSQAALIQNQAAFVQTQAAFVQTQATLAQNQAAFLARMAEMDRINSERFARIEALLLDHSRILAEHTRILADHGRMLAALPDAIRDKIGFKLPQQPGQPSGQGQQS